MGPHDGVSALVKGRRKTLFVQARVLRKAVCAHMEVAIYKPGTGSLLGTESVSTSIVDFSSPELRETNV